MEPQGIIQQAVDRYNPSHVFGLFSGGHDSLCSTHIASQHPRFDGCIHINTGIGIEETREFVRDTCAKYGWSLKEYHPPESFEDMVIEHGFPGPGQHNTMYIRLKERALRQVMRDHGLRSRKIMFITGVRRQESIRRMGTIQGAITEGPSPSGRAIWVAPIIAWGATEKNSYIQANKLPRNPVVELLCMSGECLCGAFATPNELDMIRDYYPEAAQEIDRISEKVQRVGKHSIWGTRPPGSRNNPNQTDLPLCYSCPAKHERANR